MADDTYRKQREAEEERKVSTKEFGEPKIKEFLIGIGVCVYWNCTSKISASGYYDLVFQPRIKFSSKVPSLVTVYPPSVTTKEGTLRAEIIADMSL